MKKMSFLAAVLAVVLVAGSSFKNNKSNKGLPTQGKESNGSLVPIEDGYRCDVASSFCLYDAAGNPVDTNGDILTPGVDAWTGAYVPPTK